MQTHVPLDPKERPRYSKEQLNAYFKRIQLAQSWLNSPLLSDPSYARTKEHGLPFIQTLMRYHTCNVPFENLVLHYGSERSISLDPSCLGDWFTDAKRGRGGRCMETNTFFGTVLRSLGFRVRNCGGRVSRMMHGIDKIRNELGQTYDGWDHMLNLVKLDDEWYVVDVGMSAMGPNMPYPLQDGFEAVSIAPRKIRLQLRTIPELAGDEEHEDDGPLMWCYDICYKPGNGPDGEDKWIPAYCFTETAFLPQDYEIMSWYTSTSPKSFFTHVIMCSRMLMSDDGEKIVGDVTLFGNVLRRTIAGKREILAEGLDEEEKVRALREYIGIDLTDDERRVVNGGPKPV